MSGSRSRLTGIDTNVLLRVLLQDDPVQGPIAARFFRELGTGSPGFITQVTLAETYWVLARAKRLPRATCLAVIRRLVVALGAVVILRRLLAARAGLVGLALLVFVAAIPVAVAFSHHNAAPPYKLFS